MRNTTYLLATIGWLGCLQAGRSLAQPSGQPTVAVVVQAGGGLPTVARLSRELASLGLHMVAQDELAAGATPDALLSIVVGPDRVVSALYWDHTGVPDALSAPAPAGSTKVETAAVTLAGALLQRHLEALQRDQREAAIYGGGGAHDAALERAIATRAVYAAIARFGLVRPRSAALSVDDF